MSDIALPNSGVSKLPRAERLLSDELLAKFTGRGSTRAFAALYERHHQAIYRYCRSILRNDHDAQDALQSTMTRAYAALRGQERDLAVRPWLFRIAHNEAISITRKRDPREAVGEDLENPVGLDQTVELRERLARLVSDMQELPERQRAALVMRELSGLSIEEIALALDISQGAAKQTLFEARSSLHEFMEGREMDCELVREAISRKDGRVLRGRRLSAHLRDCEECRAFRTSIDVRGADLRALAPPLPALTASAMLGHLLAHGGGHASGTAASGATFAGGHVAGSLLAKGLVGVVAIAAAAGTVKLTAKHQVVTPSHSGSHRASAHPHEAITSSPTAGSGATLRRGVSGAQHNPAGASGSVTSGSPPAASATAPSVSSTPSGQVTPGRHNHGQATHVGARGVVHGKAHHPTKKPAHRTPVHPANHGSRQAPAHPTHPTRGQGEKSQVTHGQSGSAGSASHSGPAQSENHVSQHEASGAENGGHANEAAQARPHR